jgi:hypothetical protein
MKSKNKNIKAKAIRMFLAGMKKGTICKKLHLNLNLLENWIYEYQKINSIKLFNYGVSKNEICKSLRLDKFMLNLWIREALDTNTVLTKPNGYSSWICNITS